jgi:hypothetical protein
MKEMVLQAGVRLEYLPPYSPDLNPIEESFHALKSWIRRNRAHPRRFEGFLELFLWMGIIQCDFKKEVKNFFRACQITVDRDYEDVDYRTQLALHLCRGELLSVQIGLVMATLTGQTKKWPVKTLGPPLPSPGTTLLSVNSHDKSGAADLSSRASSRQAIGLCSDSGLKYDLQRGKLLSRYRKTVQLWETDCSVLRPSS